MVVGGFGDYEDYEDWKLQSRTSSETTKMIMVLQRDNVSGTSLRSITVFERVDRNPLEGVRCTILLRQRQHQTPAVLETWYGLRDFKSVADPLCVVRERQNVKKSRLVLVVAR